MKMLTLVKDHARNRDKWRSLTTGNRPTLPQCDNEGVILYGLRSCDLNVNDDDDDDSRNAIQSNT